MTLKILLLCLVTISWVACHGPGGHGGHGGGGFHGGGYHGGHGRRPWGHGHWGDRRDPGWRPDGHHGHHDHREPKPDEPRPDPKSPDPSRPQVNFIVHEPQGLEVWIVQQPEITSFGIELYVNKDSRETGAYCDLCANTTEVTYGKLFIDNQDVLVKKGDTLSYYAWIGRGGQFTRSGLQTLVVTESIVTQCDCGTSNIEDIDIRINDDSDKRTGREAIFTRKAGQSPRVGFTTTEATDPDKIRKEYREDMISECDIDPEQCQTSKAEAKTDRAIQDPHREIVILEDIVEHMKGGSCLPKVTNQLVLLRQAPFAANGDGDLMNFVRSYVGISAELQSLGEGIVRVIPANPGVGQGVVFEMGSYADKQRILYHVRDNELKHIVDYDLTENSY
ncbi:hypothetical protein quinque_010987 [Culex quinquefasciatus]